MQTPHTPGINISNATVKSVVNALTYKASAQQLNKQTDSIIKELPLQIVIAYGNSSNRKREILSVTMRTPGDDFNLVKGFLFCEGIIRQAGDIVSMRYIGDTEDETLSESILLVELAEEVIFNKTGTSRNFIINSSCGYCGKTMSDLGIGEEVFLPLKKNMLIHLKDLYRLPALLQSSQGLFNTTGGAHGVALINNKLEITAMAEDVGRHNAMDKLVGAMLNQQALPLHQHLVLFSGRLSYELVQKSLMAGIPFICAIGAPTSLAVELAEAYGITLIGFLKSESFNVYSGAEKIIQS